MNIIKRARKQARKQVRKNNMKEKTSTGEQIQQICDLLIFARKPFELVITNYTASVKSDFFPHKSVENLKGPRFFVGCRMVEKDCKTKPLPDVEKKVIQYNDFNISKEVYLENIYGVDINSAYPSILYRDGYISKKTYGYLAKLPKLDRLGAIGYLAGRKNVFKYNSKGQIVQYREEIKTDTENYFYYAVKKTAEAMQEAREIIEGLYFFTWVDCIYLQSLEDAERVVNLLKSLGLNSKVNKYEQFLVKKKTNGKLVCTFIDEEQEVKTFFIPLPKEKIKNAVTNYLLNHKTIKK